MHLLIRAILILIVWIAAEQLLEKIRLKVGKVYPFIQ